MSLETMECAEHLFFTEDDFTQEEKMRSNALFLLVKEGYKICKVCGYDNVPEEGDYV